MRTFFLITLILVSILASALMVVGLVMALHDDVGTQIASSTTKQKEVPAIQQPSDDAINLESDTIRILGLGDSLTVGVGDETNQGGYFGEVGRQLQSKTAKKVESINIAVGGARANDLLMQLDDPTVLNEVKQANIILLSIGGNDLNQNGQTLLALDAQQINELQRDFRQKLTSILAAIRSQNRLATIYMIGLYDPFRFLTETRATSKYVVEWNEATLDVITSDERTVFVPTFDLFQLQLEQYLADDQFHPNHAGYQQFATRILASLPNLIGGERRE